MVCTVNRVRKLSMEILDKYESSFGENFEDNKKTLMEISAITSKELKNEIAGFITKTIKREIREQQKREADQRAREEEAAELARIEAGKQESPGSTELQDGSSAQAADELVEQPTVEPDTQPPEQPAAEPSEDAAVQPPPEQPAAEPAEDTTEQPPTKDADQPVSEQSAGTSAKQS